MMQNILKACFILLLMGGSSLFAQEPQEPEDPPQRATNPQQVIQLEAQIVDTRVELPQVQILDKRKKTDFDEVKVEKSFTSELSSKSEELKFTPNTSGKIKSIKDIQSLLNKKRF